MADRGRIRRRTCGPEVRGGVLWASGQWGLATAPCRPAALERESAGGGCRTLALLWDHETGRPSCTARGRDVIGWALELGSVR